ncbi:hypothetical protein LZ554_003700 [Drepanopeziza brunnea f. sp. 'monogermtubi']|nr:hypothetical protein LZ554_003700 [Drepanopeziza brunnea f. sp. 'monogermtubi']
MQRNTERQQDNNLLAVASRIPLAYLTSLAMIGDDWPGLVWPCIDPFLAFGVSPSEPSKPPPLPLWLFSPTFQVPTNSSNPSTL